MNLASPYRYALSTLFVAVAFAVFPSIIAAQQVALSLQRAMAQSQKPGSLLFPGVATIYCDEVPEGHTEKSPAVDCRGSGVPRRQVPKGRLKRDSDSWPTRIGFSRPDWTDVEGLPRSAAPKRWAIFGRPSRGSEWSTTVCWRLPQQVPEKQKTETVRVPDAKPAASDDEAQATQGPSSAAQPPSRYAERRFPKDLLRDQKAIWTSPLRIGRSDARWLVPIAAATAAMIATDRRASGELGDSKDLREVSRNISYLGSGYTMLGAAGTIYAIGRFTHNERATDVGLLGLRAVIDSAAAVGALKLATNRERPNMRRGDGRFWVGGKSFPSGHAAFSWALAAVIAQEYRDKPIVRFGAYGLATAVSLSRFTGRTHFPSDVLVGSTLGYLIGRYVVKQHNTPQSGHRSAVISPYLNRPTSTYGLAVSFRF
jgi:membrane-associated phospholipid phosphatase